MYMYVCCVYIYMYIHAQEEGDFAAASVKKCVPNTFASQLPLFSPDFARLLGCLRIFLYNAKPSFEIVKWMAKHMLWQNMKINQIMQKT